MYYVAVVSVRLLMVECMYWQEDRWRAAPFRLVCSCVDCTKCGRVPVTCVHVGIGSCTTHLQWRGEMSRTGVWPVQ